MPPSANFWVYVLFAGYWVVEILNWHRTNLTNYVKI